MNTAKSLIESLGFIHSKPGQDGFYTDCDEETVIETLDNNCIKFDTLCDQSTWIFKDNSYITTNEDCYFTGDDIEEFEWAHSEWSHQGKSFSFLNL